MIQRLSCGLSIPLTTSNHKVARITSGDGCHDLYQEWADFNDVKMEIPLYVKDWADVNEDVQMENSLKLGDFVSCCENNTRSNERGSGLSHDNDED